MKKKTDTKKTLVELKASKYFKKLINKSDDSAGKYFLEEIQLKEIKKIKLLIIFYAAIIGTIFVLLLIVPQHIFPKLFVSVNVYISPIDDTLNLPIVSIIYGLILSILEIYLLTVANLYGVYKIAQICNFPSILDPDHKKHLDDLIAMGVDKKNKNILTLGINPLAEISKFNLVLFFIINQLKATVTNMLFKILVKRILGRFALRFFVDLAGIPVYCFWNGYASYKVMKKAELHVVTPALIDELCEELYLKHQNNKEFKNVLYDALQFIAISKRDFHHNHYRLAIEILKTFKIKIKDEHNYDKMFLTNIKNLNPETQEGVLRLIIFGILIDGKLSRHEVKALKKLYIEKIIPFDLKILKKWLKSFVNGKGLKELFTTKFIYN